MSAVGFSLGEAAGSLWRRRAASVLSILTIALALLVLAAFLLVNLNVQRWTTQWTEAAEISVYLADDATTEFRAALRERLASDPLVASVEFVSSGEAGRRFAGLFPDLAPTIASLGPQALPASFEVRLKRQGAELEGATVDQLAGRLRTLPGVADVRYDRQFVARLQALIGAGRAVAIVLALILVAAAALTVASVVRLALHARRHEVEIMHLVGAPLAYIRGPFVMEGLLQGGIGAVLAVAALYALYLAGRTRMAALAVVWPGAGPEALAFLPVTWLAGVLAGGMVVGCVGGFIAARAAR